MQAHGSVGRLDAGGHRYAAFGLTISSCVPCPALSSAEAEPDVVVRYGDVPAQLPNVVDAGVRYQAGPGQLLLRVDGVARFLVENGRDIVIDRDPAATDDDVRVFLLGSAFAALLHQRGDLVLQGSVVKIDDGCVVFLGKSGVGKSTLAAALARRGYPCLSDDVCAISVGDAGVPSAAPAYPEVRLAVDSLRRLSIDAASLRRVRPSLEQRLWPVEGPFNTERTPVRRLFCLLPSRDTAGPALQSVAGAAKIRILRENTYRLTFLKGLGLRVRHFGQIERLCSQLTVTNIVRPRDRFLIGELADLVEGALRS